MVIRCISDFQKPCVSKTAVFRMNDTSRSLCYPVYVVIVFHLVKQSAKPLGFLFGVTGNFKTSAPNCPQMTLNTKTSKVPHIHTCIITIPDSQFSLCFDASGFGATGHFETRMPNNHKMTLNTKGQMYHIYIHITIPLNSKFHSVLHCGQGHFRVAGKFDTSALNNPKMTLNTKRWKLRCIHN